MRRFVGMLVVLAAFAAPAAAQAAVPTGVTAIALDGRVDVAWSPGVAGSSYAVYRGTSASNVNTQVSPPGFATSFTDTTVANGTTYYYAVRATVSGFESANSIVVSAKPVARGCSSGNPVVVENCYPGDSGWNARNVGNPSSGGIEGFATAQSINKGESVDLKVNSGGQPFDVEIYRSGYYGGAGARLMSVMRAVPGVAQPTCQSNSSTGLLDCSNWATSTTLTTTSSWPSGMYLLRIVRNGTNEDNHILLAVRDDSRNPDVIYGASFTTYQSYNNYGGKSLYTFNSFGSNTVSGTTRAVKVSYDRPFEQPRSGQRDWYTFVDQPTVAFLEQQGYDVGYVSNTDLERAPSLILSAKAYISSSHDEYWSAGMRTAAEQARDAGHGIFFTGGNEVYWKIRFEASPYSGQGMRVQVCYKTTESGGADPSGIPTTTWRDPAGANKPENALAGQQYIGDNDTGYFPFVVTAAQGTDRIYRYTGLDTQQPGRSASIGRTLVGWEWDARASNGFEPAGVKTLSSSPVTGELLQDAGRVYAQNRTATVSMVKYTAPSGALVVSTGTNQWWRGLGFSAINEGEPDDRIQQTTVNILADMGATPATPASGITLDTPVGNVPSPTGVTASAAGSDSIAVSWNPVSGASGYNVYRALSPRQGGQPLGQRVNATAVTGTSFTDTGLNAGFTYYYVVTAIVGGVQSPPSSEVSATTQASAGSATRINVGGPDYTSSSGAAFTADRLFSGGSTNAITQSISGTNDPALYQDERWGQFSYAIPVANGTYDVRLHFAELYYGTVVAGGAGKRVFGMDVLDTPQSPDLSNIDIYAQVGARAALVKTISGVTVTDGTLDIRSVYGAADDPEVTAIEVVPAGPAGPPTVTSTSPADAATNVPASVHPSATFSRAMDASTLTSSTFTLTPAGGSAVSATVAYDANTRTATLTPSAALAASTSYTARLSTAVKASDGTALANAVSWTFSTGAPPPPDTTPPTVSMTAPSAGATVSATTTVSANASDNVGVVGVQFRLDNANLGSEDTTSPYSASWDTTTTSNGTHTLTAIARDAAGNTTTATSVTVTVDNRPVDPSGLVGAWSFDESSPTTVTDASSQHNDGTIVGGVTRTASGKFGGALTFNGTNGRVTVPDSNSLDLTNAMTLEAWVYPTTLTNWRTAILKEQTGDLVYGIYANTDTNRPSGELFTSGEVDTRSTAQLALNTWTHLATTYDGATLRLYANGTLVASKAVTGAIKASTGVLDFGGNGVWGEWFAGRLDEIRVYNRALSAAEVSTDMNTPVGTQAPPDTQAPSAPGTLTATGQLGAAKLTWGAATDNVGVTEYRVYRSQTSGFTPNDATNRIAQVTTGTTYTDTTAAAGTWYYRIIAVDAAGNLGPPSNEASATVTADTTAPSVSITAPAAGATVSSTVTVSANATDDVGVASVQFRVDGADVGSPDTASPYSITWDSRTVANGTHAITAVAKDGAGNSTTSAPVSVTVSNSAQPAGLVAAYGFEETSGTTATDSSGTGNDGTINGATRTTSGKFGSALTFNGSSNQVTVADSPSLDLTNGMTLEAWVYPTTLTNWRTVLLKEQTGDLVYGIYANTDTNRPSGEVFVGGEVDTRGTAKLAVNAWTHLAATYDGATLRLYVNGTQVSSHAIAGAMSPSTGALRIGGNTIWGEWFAGRIDEVRVYNRALTATAVQADMNAAVRP